MRPLMAPMTRLILVSSLFWGGPVLAAEPVPAPPQHVPNSVITDRTGGQWRTLTNMTTPRIWHTATLLPDGTVLVVGGGDTDERQKTVEIFDPAANNGLGAWHTVAPLHFPRAGHTSTLLPNGQVLVMGGNRHEIIQEQHIFTTHQTVEIYDPVSNDGMGSWTVLTPLHVPRFLHTSILMPNGKVLVVGGGIYDDHKTLELYDPAAEKGQGASRIIGDLKTLYPTTAALLPTGQVLVVGAERSRGDCRHRALLITLAPDEQSLTITQASRTLDLCDSTITLTPNGTLLITGVTTGQEGMNQKPVFFVYDPNPALSSSKAWNQVALPPRISDKYTSRDFVEAPYSSATLLPNGKVLLIGRHAVRLYDPAVPGRAAWSTLNRQFARLRHTATLLPDGTILVMGGLHNNVHGNPTAEFADNVQRYTPAPKQ